MPPEEMDLVFDQVQAEATHAIVLMVMRSAGKEIERPVWGRDGRYDRPRYDSHVNELTRQTLAGMDPLGVSAMPNNVLAALRRVQRLCLSNQGRNSSWEALTETERASMLRQLELEIDTITITASVASDSRLGLRPSADEPVVTLRSQAADQPSVVMTFPVSCLFPPVQQNRFAGR